MAAHLVERLGKGNEIARDDAGSLMDQLVERMLPICSGLAPVDGSGIVGDGFAIERDMLPITLHGQLLQIRRESFQVLLVRQDCDGLCVEKVVVPKSEQAHEHRQVAFEWGSPKMLVHLVKAV